MKREVKLLIHSFGQLDNIMYLRWGSWLRKHFFSHYSDVIIVTMASQLTSVWIVCSAICSGADQRKHQSSASLAFVRGLHRGPVNSPHKWPVTRKCFHLMTSSWGEGSVICIPICRYISKLSYWNRILYGSAAFTSKLSIQRSPKGICQCWCTCISSHGDLVISTRVNVSTSRKLNKHEAQMYPPEKNVLTNGSSNLIMDMESNPPWNVK